MTEKAYVQSDTKKCAAQSRPDYCFFASNVCCFSCDKNGECFSIATEKKAIRPCRPMMPITMLNSVVEHVELFDEYEQCEFSI